MVEMRGCRTASQLCQALLESLRCYGVTNVLAGMVPPLNSPWRGQKSHVLLDGWPAEWSRRYFSRGYLDRDPAIRLVRRGTPCFHWHEIGELCPVCPVGRRILDEACEYRLREGMTYAFVTPENAALGFSVAAEKLEVADAELYSLQLIAAFGLGCAIALATGRTDYEEVQLSRRQREVLLWVCEGLNPEQIGDQMGISRHTADMHLRSVRAKFGVTTSIQAAAAAFRLGLIN